MATRPTASAMMSSLATDSASRTSDDYDVKSARDIETQPHDVVKKEEEDPGVARIEALYRVFGAGGTKIWTLYISILLISYAASLDSSVSYTYYAIATSAFSAHSLLGAIDVAVSIMGSVCRPFIAKIADHVSRPWAYLFSLVFYVIGYIIIASSKTVNAFAAGQVIYKVGNVGLDLVTTIVIGDVSPLQWRGLFQGINSAPWIINSFIAGYITADLGTGGWRWGYGMFCLILPACMAPALMIMFWADIKAKKMGALSLAASDYTARVRAGKEERKSWHKIVLEMLIVIDAFGLVLLGVGFSLILLPFTLYTTAKEGWRNPSLIAMFIVGGILLIAFTLWELYVTNHPIMPRRIWNRTFIMCVIIDALYYFGGYLGDTYFSSWVYVVKDWSLRDYTFFTNTLTVGLCFFGIVAGLLMRITHRYKYIQVIGLCIRSLGLGLRLHTSLRGNPDAELVMTQVIISMGGAFSVVGSQVGSQASVPHTDMATAISLLGMLTNLGGAIGSAVAAAVWGHWMPKNLTAQLSGLLSAEQIEEIYGSITTARTQPDNIRTGVIKAYNDTVFRLYLPALIISFVAILAGLLASNFRLDSRQNAIEDKAVIGFETEAEHDSAKDSEKDSEKEKHPSTETKG
ncbi:MFS general substrate transporter [Lentinus tigrinus ALCF2SS1-7]|uniref:MFS general substrate transporter n=1 Tax=Lentinus tigrinus ALCF2SS1-6 TaxID=1328759 RepID=A0A5C2RX71_9APHY|nr:MFS general substrate transporter [Lentinus tigrinus ALCF2SS1-6]RPD70674.1 MFS general substrate transporter [Lentinus tigrinus ALCF2SS1-7]